MIVVLHGPDPFLVRAELARLLEQHDPDGLNTTRLDARSVRSDEILAALGTPGFFGSGRVIVVNDLLAQGARGASSATDDDETPKAKSAIDWAAVFAAVEASNTALFVDAEMASIPAAVKKALPSSVKVFAGDSPRGNELLGWIKAHAKQCGASIDTETARYLADTLCPRTWGAKPTNPAYDRPPDLESFANELAKLSMAGDGTITRATIDEMTAAAQPDSLFPLIDAFVAGDTAGALRELRRAIDNGDELGRMSAQLFQQIELLAVMQAAGSGTDPVELGKALGLSNPNRMFAVQKSLGRLRAHPRSLVEAAAASERAFKLGVLRQPLDQIYDLLEGARTAVPAKHEGGN